MTDLFEQPLVASPVSDLRKVREYIEVHPGVEIVVAVRRVVGSPQWGSIVGRFEAVLDIPSCDPFGLHQWQVVHSHAEVLALVDRVIEAWS